MGDFWDHAFKALGHIADAQSQNRAEQAEQARRPKRKVKLKPGAEAPAPVKSFDGPGSDPTCCVTSRRTIKLGE